MQDQNNVQEASGEGGIEDNSVFLYIPGSRFGKDCGVA